ncbi:MAG: beta-N-acetylhexosaminidase [Alistipes sp.]|nr:beta-N-acetylhexosaminidase [Alistipes sp.]
MKQMSIFLAAMALMVGCSRHVESMGSVSVIPCPAKVELAQGVFTLAPSTVVALHFEDAGLPAAVALINRVLEPIFGRALAIVGSDEAPMENVINIFRSAEIADEGYTLDITPSAIDIAAADAHGVFYALQTLRQMLPVEALKGRVGSVDIPAAKIEDAPHFQYRGLLLDVGRYFFDVDEVKSMIDIAAMHKMNYFHWHLTEDQGWRIEIKKYPRLTEVGSRRDDSMEIGVHYARGAKLKGEPYGPFFYTQEQIREVVRYAEERFVTIIPEIDLPGHMVAALASYPHLGCVGEGYKVRVSWGISEDVMCVGKESTFEFIEDVLTEVLDLFPSEYIHIGGDECPRVAWTKCPHCQARMKAEGLTSEAQLQTYCNHRVEAFLQKHGRKMIGWDEILEGGVSPTTTVMSWTGVEGGIAAAKAGNPVVMTPRNYFYINRPQSRHLEKEPPFGQPKNKAPRYLTLDSIYKYNPYDRLTADEQRNIKGVEACLWTEQIDTYDYLEYLTLPRLSAVSEVAWSLNHRDWNRYISDLEHLRKLYDYHGYNYATSYWRDNE